MIRYFIIAATILVSTAASVAQPAPVEGLTFSFFGEVVKLLRQIEANTSDSHQALLRIEKKIGAPVASPRPDLVVPYPPAGRECAGNDCAAASKAACVALGYKGGQSTEVRTTRDLQFYPGERGRTPDWVEKQFMMGVVCKDT